MAGEKKACLICIDGWGLSDKAHGNSIMAAKTPVMDSFKKDHQFARVDASGLSVGLPEGVMGNSEVGHLTIGAGQCEYQDLVRINLALEDGSFFKNEVLLNAFKRAKEGNGRFHLLGLLSDGGVHSHQKHLYALLKAAKENGVPQAYVQAFMDGRDTPPTSGAGYMQQLLDVISELGYGKVGTIGGRYYAMDRDKRWDRVKLGYEGIVAGIGEENSDPIAAIKARYEAGENDEFLKPIIVDKEGCVKDGDTCLFFDFRADRMREIVETMGIKPPFKTDHIRKDVKVVCYTQYKSEFPLDVVFPPQQLKNGLAEWISKKGLKQFHTAETEKYAHVTFFFNGGREDAFENEDREMVPSPQVATYDLKPEMNAAGVAESVCRAMDKQEYALVMCNFAPPDMVGHTGSYEQCIVACEATDKAIGEIFEGCKKNGYQLFITSDHGNAEAMIDDNNNPITKHSTNFVPFIMANSEHKFNRGEGTVRDVAPTILATMGIEPPSEMTGQSFV